MYILTRVWQEELGEDYEVVKYQRDANGRAPPELKKVHPLGVAPVITDGKIVLAESGAIVRACSEATATALARF